MRRGVSILFLTLICVCASAQTRLNPELYNFISLHGDLGYSALLHNIPEQPAAAGMNTNIGADYRLLYNHFLFSLGVEGMYELNVNRIAKVDESIPMKDTEGQIFDMHVRVDKARDLSHMVNLNIPVLFGGEWGRFYFMVGPKVSMSFYGSTSSTSVFTTYGEYDKYYDYFYDMINHQFSSGQTTSSGVMPLKWNMNVMAHVEIGGRINHMFKHKQFRINPDKVRMYLAGFVDFGLLNLHTGSGGSPIFEYRETPDQGVQFYVQPLITSNLADGKTFRNFNIGIKYTVAFELPRHGKSYVYDYYKVDRNYRIRGGNQNIKQ